MEKKRKRKRLLLTVRESDNEVASYYTDGTYRYRNWPKTKYSKWKIEDDKWYFKHRGHKWMVCDDDDEGEIVYEGFQELKEAMAESILFK